MNVLFLTHATCARARKQAVALISRGVDIRVLQFKAADQMTFYTLPSMAFYSGKSTLPESLKRFEDWADIIHIHNEPDWMVAIAREVCPDIPIVYDCHDLSSQRDGTATPAETAAMEAADAYIFPSKSYIEGAVEYHNLPDYKPRRLIYSYCLAQDIVQGSYPPVPAVVYEGGIVAKGEAFDNETATFPRHRDYEAIAWEFREAGIPLALYGVQDAFLGTYLATGAMAFMPISYNYLLPQLSRYSWGFVGAPIDCPQWHKAMPNKLFEYLAAGIPVIVYKADEVAEWVRERDVGVVIDKISDINDIGQDRYDTLTQHVHDIRDSLTMESQTDTIMDLYRLLA